ncbi:MAG TPA: GMC family oxidoreductase [Blastocatellia bacterium]|nr:GMC family oxidoreductase [Blastocatellia bacterium]
MLSKDWDKRKKQYDFIIIGSGYGGAINAARITAANPSPSVCILERGKEWEVGKFPDNLLDVQRAVRNDVFNPTGLYDFQLFPDVTVMKGSGLGGTSLINANVAIVPDEETFQQLAWPKNIKLPELKPFYDKARTMLGARPHKRGTASDANAFLKVKGLDKRAQEIGTNEYALNIVVTQQDGKNAAGFDQKACVDCGDCVTGCNVGAKNTLYMNYLPTAAKQGCDIFTKVEVKWVEKLPTGGWRVHGVRYKTLGSEDFTLDAGHIILSAGSLGTPEVLLRSEMHGLSLSPKLGTQFSGNGDFFALAYNTDHQLNTIGFPGKKPDHEWAKRGNAPGPSIVGAVYYGSKETPLDKRILVEDFSFPSSYLNLAMGALRLIGRAGEDMDFGDEKQEKARMDKDHPWNLYKENDGALNHSMLYLIMGHDDAQGRLHLRHESGHVEIDWDDAGRQQVFNLINEEIRRHARALGGTFLTNPLWSITPTKNLLTAHPLGGAPLGDDYQHGAVDEFGRVFASDGSIHDGLFVADGSLVATALGVNPFLTISALSERIADRIVRNLGGEAYPPRPAKIVVPDIKPQTALTYKEADLERLFKRLQTGGIETMANSGEVKIDTDNGLIRNDTVWKGVFPKGHVLNAFSTALNASFKKRFTKQADGKFTGVTSDSDGGINALNTLEEITITERTGTLEPGKYILLKYTEPQWRGFYDVFKVINDDLLIGRVYLGRYPKGVRLFTFPMVRSYGLDQMTISDHKAIWDSAALPTKEQLAGLWEMRMVSNANNTGVVAYLKFDHKPDGRLEARYQFLGLIEGLADPTFGQEHFRMDDFTSFHDEIRFVNNDMLIGQYFTDARPPLLPLFGQDSLGIFQREQEADGDVRFGFKYWLSRSTLTDTPVSGFMRPVLDVRLPEKTGLTFDEEMKGFYYHGYTPPAGADGDRQIEAKSSAEGTACELNLRVSARDFNEFIEGWDHEMRIDGDIRFANFNGQGQLICTINGTKSFFNYLRVNPATKEAEMLYRIYFFTGPGQEYCFHGRKFLQKDNDGGRSGIREIVHDFTTLYGRLTDVKAGREVGSALMKFRTFEDADALRSFSNYLESFRVTGENINDFVQAQGRLRFLALTNQFVAREYDPVGALLNS